MAFCSISSLLNGRHVRLQSRPLQGFSLRSIVRSRGCAQALSSDSPFTLHLESTTLTLPFSVEEGNTLSEQFDKLLQTFAAKQKAERPRRWDSLEYRLQNGDGDASISFLEVFCNPNMHSTPFDAKLLVTVRTTDGLKIVTEGSFSTVKSDLEVFLEQES